MILLYASYATQKEFTASYCSQPKNDDDTIFVMLLALTMIVRYVQKYNSVKGLY